MDELREPGEDEELEEEGIEEANFDRRSVDLLYRSGYLDINPERWLRAKEDIHFDDLVVRLTGFSSTMISCPFHGRDSTPSFHLYRRGNDAWCFGCPPGKNYYDSIIFVSERLGISRLAALQWLENTYNLPPIADLKPEEAEELHAGDPLLVTFRDLLPAYVEHARRDIRAARDVDLAKEYLEILFGAWPPRNEEQTNPNAGEAIPLARVLGKPAINYILQNKAR
jgi:hypothetical protein